MKKKESSNKACYDYVVDQLFCDINQPNQYSPSQEREYIERIKDGDLKARDDFFRYNLRVVVTIAHRYINRGIPLEDIVQAGSIGIIEALENFDLNRKKAFNTYSKYYIVKNIEDLFYNKTMIRYPENQKDLFCKIIRMELNLSKELTKEELIELTGISTYYADMYIQYKNGTYSKEFLEEALGKGEFESLIIDELDYKQYQNTSSIDMQRFLDRIKIILTENQYHSLCSRIGLIDGDCCLLKEIGEDLGITFQAVNQAVKMATNIIKKDKQAMKFLVLE